MKTRTEISETEIKSMTKEQNYMRGYRDGKSDVLDKIRAEISNLKGTFPREYYLKIIDKYNESEGINEDTNRNIK